MSLVPEEMSRPSDHGTILAVLSISLSHSRFFPRASALGDDVWLGFPVYLLQCCWRGPRVGERARRRHRVCSISTGGASIAHTPSTLLLPCASPEGGIEIRNSQQKSMQLYCLLLGRTREIGVDGNAAISVRAARSS